MRDKKKFYLARYTKKVWLDSYGKEAEADWYNYNCPDNIYNYLEFMIDMLEGVVENDSLFGLIYTLDEGDDYHDRSVWPKVNPNLGVTVDESYV